MKGRPRALPDDSDALRKLRQWRALPRGRRPRTLEGMAALLGIAPHLAKRAAYGMRAYKDVRL